jgi:hypothetical protein
VLYLGVDWLSVADDFDSLGTCRHGAFKTQFRNLKILDSSCICADVAGVLLEKPRWPLMAFVSFFTNPLTNVRFVLNTRSEVITLKDAKLRVVERIDRSPELWDAVLVPTIEEFKTAIMEPASVVGIIELIANYPDFPHSSPADTDRVKR